MLEFDYVKLSWIYCQYQHIIGKHEMHTFYKIKNERWVDFAGK